jgi:hypothetical protein
MVRYNDKLFLLCRTDTYKRGERDRKIERVSEKDRECERETESDFLLGCTDTWRLGLGLGIEIRVPDRLPNTSRRVTTSVLLSERTFVSTLFN